TVVDDSLSSPQSTPPTSHTLSLHDALPISMILFTTTPLTPTMMHMILLSATCTKSMLRTVNCSSVGMKTMPTWSLSLERRLEARSEEHTSELQSRFDLVCRLLFDKKNR